MACCKAYIAPQEWIESMRTILLAVLLLALPGSTVAQPTARSQGRHVPVELSSFKFTPSTIILTHDQPYVLDLTNRSSGGHDFAATAFFQAARIDPADEGLIHKGKIALKRGESVSIRLVAPPAGEYELHCSHFMHAGFGMKGTIRVE